MAKDDLERRRARVKRIVTKRPTAVVTVTYAPRPGAYERLLDVLFDLLDERRRVGRK